MHGYANPARFLKIARPATAWLLGIGLLLLWRMAGGLIVTPPDYLQGETVRILYIHVPAAWLGMAGGRDRRRLDQPAGLAASAGGGCRSRDRARRRDVRRRCAWPPDRSGAARPGAPGGNGTAG